MNVHCLLGLFLSICLLACSEKTEKSSHFEGDPEAVQMAQVMFDTLGGMNAWKQTKALYIKAVHEEEDLEYPYQSEIWRDLDSFKLRIEQQSPEFHRIGLFSDEGAWIIYEDLDSTRQLSKESQEAWRYENEHNIYVMLKRIASKPGYQVTKTQNRLEFTQDTTFLFAVKLDDQYRPHIYITRSQEGEEQVTRFTKWNRHKHQGQLHPVAGGPTDGDFTYETEKWEPHRVNYDKAFNIYATPQ